MKTKTNYKKQGPKNINLNQNYKYIMVHSSSSDYMQFFFSFNCYYDSFISNIVQKYNAALSVFSVNEDDYYKVMQFNGNYDILKSEILITPCKCKSLSTIIFNLIDKKGSFKYHFEDGALKLRNILGDLHAEFDQNVDDDCFRLILFLFAVGLEENRNKVTKLILDNNIQMEKDSLDGVSIYFPYLVEISLKGCNLSHLDLSDIELNLVNINHQKIEIITGYLDQIKKQNIRTCKKYPIKAEYVAKPFNKTFDDYPSCTIDVSENDLNKFIFMLYNIQWNEIQKVSFFYLDESVFSFMVSDELLDHQTYLFQLF